MRAFVASFDAVVALLVALSFTAILSGMIAGYKFDVSRITMARIAKDVLTVAEEKAFEVNATQQVFEMSPFCHVLEIYADGNLIEVNAKAGCESPTTEWITWGEFYRNGSFYLAKLTTW